MGPENEMDQASGTPHLYRSFSVFHLWQKILFKAPLKNLEGMYTHEITTRVRYGETDQMGFVYYGNYAGYYEIGRVEALRALGLSYADMEKKVGVFMPVMSLEVRYLRPARYDELLTIRTTVPRLPQMDILFLCEIYNAEGQLLNKGRIRLCFLEVGSHRRVDVPTMIQDKLKEYFGQN